MERQRLHSTMGKEKRSCTVKLLSIAFIVAQMMTWSRLGTYTSLCMSMTEVENTSTSDYMYTTFSRRTAEVKSKIDFVFGGTLSAETRFMNSLKSNGDLVEIEANSTEIPETNKKSFKVVNMIGKGSNWFRTTAEKFPELKVVVGLDNPWKLLEARLENDTAFDIRSSVYKLQFENQLMALGKFGLSREELSRLMDSSEDVGLLSPTHSLKVLLLPSFGEVEALSRDVSAFLDVDVVFSSDDMPQSKEQLSKIQLPKVCAPARRQAREALVLQARRSVDWVLKFAGHSDVSFGGLNEPEFLAWLESFTVNPCGDPRIVEPEAAILYDQMANPAYLEMDEGRNLRFPPIQDRVKFYMSSWYTPPCEDYSAGFVKYHYPEKAISTLELRYAGHKSKLMANRSLMLNTDVENDKLFHVREEALIQCTKNNPNKAMKEIYCPDLIKFVLPFRDSFFDENGGTVPLIAQMGDAARAKNARRVQLPHLKKVRPHVDPETLAAITSPDCIREPRPHLADDRLMPIIWKLKFKRHFPNLEELAAEDIPWSEKKDKAIFRGTFTGPNVDRITNVEERCEISPRCRVVRQMANSTLVNAKLTSLAGKVPESLGGVSLLGGLMDRKELLKYKALVMLEGNDVSTGLKWALYSNSVVLIPHSTSSSWAMEGMLVPWIHYVPLNPDLSDIESKMQWILEHDKEARYIAKRGSLWIHDLLFHRHSVEDNDAVDKEILRRYRAHFRPLIIRN